MPVLSSEWCRFTTKKKHLICVPRKPEPPKPESPEPENFARPRVPETFRRNLEPVPGTWVPGIPGTRFLPGTAPARPEHTEINIAQRPKKHSAAGNNKKPWRNGGCCLWTGILIGFSQVLQHRKALSLDVVGKCCVTLCRFLFCCNLGSLL